MKVRKGIWFTNYSYKYLVNHDLLVVRNSLEIGKK